MVCTVHLSLQSIVYYLLPTRSTSTRLDYSLLSAQVTVAALPTSYHTTWFSLSLDVEVESRGILFPYHTS